MGEVKTDFPLFPLGIVALPSELIPLHIFEERYKAMIAHCLESASEFGIVFSGDDGLAEVGCAVTVDQVLEQLEDGRLNILCRGTRPLRILETIESLPYPAARVEFLDDDNDDTVEEGDRDTAHEAYAELVRQATDKDPDPLELSEMTAYEMASTVEFGPEAKQGLLVLRSESARLALVTRLFRAAAKRLDYVERSQVLARSNGKVRFPEKSG